jgi:hypothetical protein
MFAKFTLREDKPIYLNPLLVTAIKNEATHARIDTVDGVWNVLETPQEIVEALNTNVKVAERSGMSNILIFFLGSIFGTLVALMVFAMFHLNDND